MSTADGYAVCEQGHRHWGIPGGALGWGEEIETGARRETVEELGPLPNGLVVKGILTDDHGGWAYHTVVMESLTRFEVRGTGRETGDQGAAWFTPAEMAALRLHPGFAHTLPLLLG